MRRINKHKVLYGTRLFMSRIIRVRLSEDLFRKYKVFCAIHDISMTQKTEKIVSDFIKKENENIKVVNIKND